jgi:YVTN family beta-propeller protein
MRRTSLALVLCLSASAVSLAAQTAGPYKVLSTAKTGGAGGFDYVYADAANRKLYVPRMDGESSRVSVFNLDTLAAVGQIPEANGRGVAVDVKSGHAFSTSKPVAMWNAKTLAPIKTIDVQGGPDGILGDSFNHRVYVLSHSAPNVTVIDAVQGSVLGTIDIGGAPEQAVSDGKGHIYIDIEDKAAIAIIDAKTMKMTGKFDLAGSGDGCAGLAIDRKNGILFAACRTPNVLVVVPIATGKVLMTLPIGKGTDGATFNPKTMEVFSSQGDGTLSIIKESSPTSFAVEQTLTTPERAKTLTLDAKTGRILLITAEFGPAPAPQPGQRFSRPPMIPDTFKIIVVGK